MEKVPKKPELLGLNVCHMIVVFMDHDKGLNIGLQEMAST